MSVGVIYNTKFYEGIMFSDLDLMPIWDKVRDGKRLSFDDGLTMYRTEDFPALGKMADWVKTKLHGNKVYFVLNRHVNPTNICVLSCGFCDYAKKKGDADSYEMSIDQILGLLDDDIKEAHIVGGHHPDWPFENYVDIVEAISSKFPNTQIKGFTASEIDYFWRRWKIPPEESLKRLKKAGLRSMPGGGAEVFSDRLHKLLFPGKASPERWLDIHRSAHKLGIPSNATMLYGHVETLEERVHHFELLRELQDETGGFLAFIPIEYQTGETQLVARRASPLDDLKTIAIARLMLDNFSHIKAYWITIYEETASIALNFGANDADGTIGQERISHAAKAESPIGITRQRMVKLIKDAGKIPVERDALYKELRIYED